MKKYLVTTAILLLLVVPNAIAGGASEAATDTVTVRVWFGREEFIPGDNFQAFHAENPNIRVEAEVVPLEQAPADLIRNHETGTAPDIVQIFHIYVTTLARQGVLMDMSEPFNRWKTEDPASYNQLIPVAWKAATSDGIPYGLSQHATAIWHVYRIDWLQRAGITQIPRTWDEVIQAGIRMRDAGFLSGAQYPYSVPAATNAGTHISLSAYFMAMGGQYSDTGLPQVDSEAGRALIEFYQTLVKERLVNPDIIAWTQGEVRGAFVGNNVGMFPMGANVFPAFVRGGRVFGQEWVAAGQPYRRGAEAEYRQFGNAFPMVVSSSAQNVDAVTKVLKYLVRPEIVGEVARRYQPATNIGVSREASFREANPWTESLEETFLSLEIAPTHLRQTQVVDLMIEMVQEAVAEPNRSPVEITRNYQRRLNALD